MSNASILAAFKAVGTGFVSGPLYWPNERIVTPDPPDIFVWVDITGLGASLLGTGTHSAIEQRGFLRFHIFVPYGEAIERAYAAADSLSSLFQVKTNIGSVVCLQTFTATPPEEGASSTDGNFFGVSISIPWVFWGST